MKINANGKIEINGIFKTKTELADLVVSKLTKETIYPVEFTSKLIDKVRKTIN